MNHPVSGTKIPELSGFFPLSLEDTVIGSDTVMLISSNHASYYGIVEGCAVTAIGKKMGTWKVSQYYWVYRKGPKQHVGNPHYAEALPLP